MLSLCDADKELPPQLWPQTPDIDPFANRTQEQLLTLLRSGAEKFNRAVLSPHINRQQYSGPAVRWLVICDNAPIDELSARIAANAGLDIHWPQSTEAESKDKSGPSDGLRTKPVTCYLQEATAQQILTVAAGSVGLLAKVEDEKSVTIFDPANYSSSSDHINLLAQQSISLWQRFILTFENDERIPNAHFAMGLIHNQINHLAEAIAQYKLVANRYSKTPLAPHALLHSSKAKVTLRDYFGAHEDLKQLIELYPDVEFSDQACIYLADATIKAGMFSEASGLYKRVYNMGLSTQWQLAAALGAGKCCFEQKDYDSASEWLTKYVTLAKDRGQREFQEAVLLLGKTNLALGKPQQARIALQLALKTQLTSQQHAQIISALVQAYTQEGNFVDALNLLESADSLQLSQQDEIELLLLRANTLCCLGLVDKAASLLDKEVQYLPDSQLKAQFTLELAKCYIAKQDFELAYKTLTEILVVVEPGPLAQQIGCLLAQVCLQLGRTSQAIAVCSQILEYNPPEELRQRALALLAEAYSRQKNYNSVVLALLGHNPQKATSENNPTNPAVKNQAPPEQTMQ
jgi:tetratricopeptide (TPR) repeat protein